MHLQYYNWRQDSYSDLQLFLVLNAGLVLLGVAIKHTVIDDLDAADPQKRSIWQDLYKASAWLLQQALRPDLLLQSDPWLRPYVPCFCIVSLAA